MHTSPTRPARDNRTWSGAAITALALGICAVISTPAFGIFTVVPAAAWIVGAYALRVTHTHNLRGRGMALWGFWLGAAFFLIDAGLLFIALIGTKMGI